METGPAILSSSANAAGSEGKDCKEEELDSLPRSRRAGPGRKRDEGREKPKGVLPPRFGGRSGDKAAPDEPGPE
jgi:hypothetical protein